MDRWIELATAMVNAIHLNAVDAKIGKSGSTPATSSVAKVVTTSDPTVSPPNMRAIARPTRFRDVEKYTAKPPDRQTARQPMMTVMMRRV